MRTLFTFTAVLLYALSFAQSEKGTVTLTDGTVVSGFVKVTNNAFKFKATENSESVKYNYEAAKEAEVTDKKGVSTKYEFIVLKEGKKPELFKIIIDGYLRLYYDESVSFGGGAMGAPSSFKNGGTYYIKRKNENVAQYYHAVSYIPKIGFKKVIESYFTDCTLLQQKVDNKEFRADDFTDVVKFYNSNCAPKS